MESSPRKNEISLSVNSSYSCSRSACRPGGGKREALTAAVSNIESRIGIICFDHLSFPLETNRWPDGYKLSVHRIEALKEAVELSPEPHVRALCVLAETRLEHLAFLESEEKAANNVVQRCVETAQIIQQVSLVTSSTKRHPSKNHFVLSFRDDSSRPSGTAPKLVITNSLNSAASWLLYRSSRQTLKVASPERKITF